MQKYEITFNEKFEAVMPTPIVLNQSDSMFQINFHIPKCIVQNSKLTTLYLQTTLPCDEKTIRLKIPEGLNAEMVEDPSNPEEFLCSSITVPGQVTSYYGRVKCSLVLKRELTEEEKIAELEAAIEDELSEDELPSEIIDVETLSSSIFYLFVKETTNYKRKVQVDDEDVVLVEIQQMIDEAQAVLKRVRNNVHDIEMTFDNYHDFANACINERKATNTREVYIANVNIDGNTHTALGMVSLNHLTEKYQAIIVSPEGRIIVSDGNFEKKINSLKLENTELYGNTVVCDTLKVPNPKTNYDATPKQYVDTKSKETIPYVGVDPPPVSLNKKIWIQLENENEETGSEVPEPTPEPAIEAISIDTEYLETPLADYENTVLNFEQEGVSVLLDETINEDVIFDELQPNEVLLEQSESNEILLDTSDDNTIYLE